MKKLEDLYTDFLRIDLDAPGGYSRVADVVARQEDGTFVHRAFKLMPHEIPDKHVVFQRYENEIKFLVKIIKDKNAPSAITKIYDSGFVEMELSKSLHMLRYKDEILRPIPNLEIISTGTDIQKFLDTKSVLMEKEQNHWFPYIVLELPPYTDSLLRQIRPQSPEDLLNLSRLPVNSIIEMALQLLDVMDYLHKKHRYAYIDWKPEHIYWNGQSKQLKLIDWNVTNRLVDSSVEKHVIREDVRMFCGCALYCSLALIDPDDLHTPIGPEPKVLKGLAPIHPRYWTDKPNFYQRNSMLSERIKLLVQKGLDPNQGFDSPQELKSALLQCVEWDER